jgi:NAD-dependent SIR2 family protein deacetylase
MHKSTSSVAILTDSNCDLPQEYFDRYPLFKLPLIINDATRSYRDEIEITVEEVHARQKDETFKTSLPRMDDIESALAHISNADVLIVGGTSLSVYPAAGFIRYFSGDHLVLINKSSTPYDNNADLLIQAGLGEVFSGLSINSF